MTKIQKNNMEGKERQCNMKVTGVLKIENPLNKQKGHSKIESKKNFLR